MNDAIAKYERGGKIAVLVSPGFGAGWSTWNSDAGEAAVFDPEIVAAILAEDMPKAIEIATSKYPDAYHGGVEDLVVQWVPKGERFLIDEYDGSESLTILGPDTGYLA